MRYALVFLLVYSCTARTVAVIEDVMEGEEKVIEKVIEDEAGVAPQRPQVVLVK